MSVIVNLSNGGSVIIWQTRSGVFFQRFDANRFALGSLTTVTNASTVWLTAAATSSGGFSIVWDTDAGSTPLAQDYTSSGTPVGGTYTVTSPVSAQDAFSSLQATKTFSNGLSSSSAVLPDGGYVLAHVEHPSGQAVSVHVQRYDSASNAVGPEFVQSTGIDQITELAVTPLANGGYAVSYIDTFNFSASLVMQLFGADGTFLRTNYAAQYGGLDITIAQQSVVALPDGGFAASWIGTNNGPAQVYVREFSASGTTVGSLQVLGAPGTPYSAPEIDAFPDGSYVLTWLSSSGVQHTTFNEASPPIQPVNNDSIATPAVAYTLPVGPHDATLIGSYAQTVTGNSQDNRIVANDYASTLIGGDGNDTLVASHTAVILTGGNGADKYAFPYLPWSAGHITDFVLGTDRLDLSALFSASNYAGSDPVADGYMRFDSDGAGGTLVYYDADGPGTNSAWTLITTLDHISPGGLTAAALLGQAAAGHMASDFNGDQHTDILWRSDSGQAAVWLMNGLTQLSGGGAGPNPGPSWQAKAAGDFNADGKADVLWQNADGTPAIWFMDGTTMLSGGTAGFNPGSAWHVIADGDFNGDGHADILWQNADGTPAVWLMNGTALVAGSALPNPGPAWHVIGAGDFNGDGKSDILWQNSDGTVAVWLMNGTALVAGSAVGTNPGSAWHVKAAGDFSGDGKSDILWQNDDGTPVLWFMNGTSFVSGAVAGFNPGSAWRAIGAGDFNDDGRADILWQNNDGTPAIWLMNGSQLISGGAFPNPGSSWHVLTMGS